MQYVLYFGIIIFGIAVAISQSIKNDKIQEENRRIEAEIRNSINKILR